MAVISSRLGWGPSDLAQCIAGTGRLGNLGQIA